MRIRESDELRIPRGAKRFYATRGALSGAGRRLRGSFFVCCAEEFIAVALSGARPSARNGMAAVFGRDEISAVTSESQLWALPVQPGELRRAALTFIDLHLRQSRLPELSEALEQAVSLPIGIQPVSQPQPGVLRLIWDAPGIQVRPGLGEALQALGAEPLAAPARDWRKLSEAELGEHILSLYDRGRFDDAMEILRSRTISLR